MEILLPYGFFFPFLHYFFPSCLHMNYCFFVLCLLEIMLIMIIHARISREGVIALVLVQVKCSVCAKCR